MMGPLEKLGSSARITTWCFAVLVGVTCLAACGGGEAGSGSFVGTTSNAAVFVQWTQNGSQLTGELREALLQTDSSNSSNPDSVSSQNSAFTGTISGSSVTLSLNQGLGSVSNLTGTLNGSELDLNYPGQDGTLITIQMHSGKASDYNAELASLQQRAGQANAQAQAAPAAQMASVASTCQAAGGQMTSDGSACVVSGIQDKVKNQGSVSAALDFPPANVAKFISQCTGNGGRWFNDPGGGYVVGQTGWDCMFGGNTTSVWNYGFEDAALSFASLQWAVPIQDGAAMRSLETQCTNAGGDFGLDTARSGNVFACLVNGTEDDVLLTPTPHYAEPL